MLATMRMPPNGASNNEMTLDRLSAQSFTRTAASHQGRCLTATCRAMLPARRAGLEIPLGTFRATLAWQQSWFLLHMGRTGNDRPAWRRLARFNRADFCRWVGGRGLLIGIGSQR